jgi:AcrR family transcriptional regulator
MSPRTQKQFEEIRETRRGQIMNAALELFAREGYANCSIAQLAAHAGISKGLMYNYFESKEALLVSLIEDGLSEFNDNFNPGQEVVLKPDELAGFIKSIFSNIRENQHFWILYINIILQPRVKEFMDGEPFNHMMNKYGPVLMDYFTEMGFEDPALEMFTLSALIEGFGVLMVYAYPGFEFPEGVIEKYEERVLGMFIPKTRFIR